MVEEPRREAVEVAACFTYEGARSFVTDISCNYRDSPYKPEWGRHNDETPSSKPARAAGDVVEGDHGHLDAVEGVEGVGHAVQRGHLS